MANLIQALLHEIWPYLAGLAGVIAGLFYVRQSGKTAGRREAETKAQKQRIKNINEAKYVENTVNQADDDAVIRRLGGWVRNRQR